MRPYRPSAPSAAAMQREKAHAAQTRRVRALLFLAFWVCLFMYWVNRKREPPTLQEVLKAEKRPVVPTSAVDDPWEACARRADQISQCRQYETVQEVHAQNRCLLLAVRQWIDRDEWKQALFGYGLPDYAFDKVAKDVGPRPTLSSAVAFLSTKLGPKPNLLELGVSVGKTLFQTLSTACDSRLVAFDLEEINPTFAHMLGHSPMHAAFRPSPAVSILNAPRNFSKAQPGYASPRKDRACTIKDYGRAKAYRGNSFQYMSCDEYDLTAWRALGSTLQAPPPGPAAASSFQLIFSDAMHTKEALDFELDRILELGLLDRDNFAVVWDDMDYDAAPLCGRIVEYAAASARNKITCLIGKMPGWLGANEYDHAVAIVTTVKIADLAQTAMQDVKFLRHRFVTAFD